MSLHRRTGFTLVELLVVVGIIAVLVGLTVPVVARARDSARRAVELSNIRQLTAACVTYAQYNDGTFPVGRLASAAPGADDYTWVNFTSCWRQLLNLSSELDRIKSCTSVREGYSEASDFGEPGNEYQRPNDTTLGWIYWGGRDDLYVNGQLQYRSMRRLGQHPTPGSQTLWTCLCWDSAGKWGPSVCPHVGTACVTYPCGVALKPPPDGLCVGLDDGSASFVRWTELIIIQQANGFKLYYQP